MESKRSCGCFPTCVPATSAAAEASWTTHPPFPPAGGRSQLLVSVSNGGGGADKRVVVASGAGGGCGCCCGPAIRSAGLPHRCPLASPRIHPRCMYRLTDRSRVAAGRPATSPPLTRSAPPGAPSLCRQGGVGVQGPRGAAARPLPRHPDDQVVCGSCREAGRPARNHAMHTCGCCRNHSWRLIPKSQRGSPRACPLPCCLRRSARADAGCLPALFPAG